MHQPSSSSERSAAALLTVPPQAGVAAHPLAACHCNCRADEWFVNTDKLIHYVNAGTAQHGLNLLYSTPADYADAKMAQKTLWTVKTDDGFPYSSNPHW